MKAERLLVHFYQGPGYMGMGIAHVDPSRQDDLEGVIEEVNKATVDKLPNTVAYLPAWAYRDLLENVKIRVMQIL